MSRQTFKAQTFPNGKFYVRSVHNGLYLDACGEGKTNGTKAIVWEFHGKANQEWIFNDQKQTITSAHNHLNLELEGSKGPNIVCWTPNDTSAAQKFLWDGSHIISVANGQVFDVCGESKKQGTRVIIYPLNNQANQRWELIDMDGNVIGGM